MKSGARPKAPPNERRPLEADQNFGDLRVYVNIRECVCQLLFGELQGCYNAFARLQLASFLVLRAMGTERLYGPIADAYGGEFCPSASLTVGFNDSEAFFMESVANDLVRPTIYIMNVSLTDGDSFLA